MRQTGYYEIGMNAGFRPDMKAFALVGNVIYNRLHWHEHLEVMCCLKGEFCMRVDGEIYCLKEGDFLTVNSNCAHEIFDGTPDGLQIIFSVDTSLLKKQEEERYSFCTVGEEALSPECEDAKRFRANVAKLADFMTPDKEELRRFFAENREHAQIKTSAGCKGVQKKKAAEKILDEDGFRRMLEQRMFSEEEDWYCFYICLYECLKCLARHKRRVENGKKNRRPKEQLQECIRLIHREYARPLDAGILAEKAGVSQPTVYRMFQKQMGISLNDYIRLVRVNAACAMLDQTSEDIAQIAFACGFSSISNFYRVFRQQTGQTPREYKNGRVYEKHRKLLPFQREVLDLNRFQNFYELPYTKADLKNFGGKRQA